MLLYYIMQTNYIKELHIIRISVTIQNIRTLLQVALVSFLPWVVRITVRLVLLMAEN
jgi:hypothetical protein